MKFEWDDKYQSSFDQLMKILVEAPVFVDHYPIHGPARLAFKWKENVKRKCGLIFEFWKIRPRGVTVLLWSRHLLLFLFLSGENQVRTKNPNDSSMEKSSPRKLDFWVRGSDYLSGRYFI